jgi:hypothetical protein
VSPTAVYGLRKAMGKSGMPEAKGNVSASREAELASAMQFLNLALGAAGSYDPTQPDHGRASIRAALVGVIRLMGALFPDKAALPISLNHLLFALHDLDRGKVAPLLQPITPSGNPGLSLAEELFRAIPAAATTCLIEHGLKRAEAAKEVARQLTAMGYRSDSGGRFEGKQIEKWREKMMTERAAENRAVAQYQLPSKRLSRWTVRQRSIFSWAPCRPFTRQTFLKTPPLNGNAVGAFSASNDHQLWRPQCLIAQRSHSTATQNVPVETAQTARLVVLGEQRCRPASAGPKWSPLTGQALACATRARALRSINVPRLGGTVMSKMKNCKVPTKDVSQCSIEGISPNGDYAVGYKRPPLHSRFKKGQSANTKGRPEGQENLKTMIERAMHQKVAVRQGKKVCNKPMFAAILNTHGRKAANGDTRSAAIIVSLVKAGLSRELDVESNPFNGKGEPHSSSPRPSSPLFANVDRSLLSDEEKIELSRLAQIVDLGGDLTALSVNDFVIARDIVNKGRGKDITPKA